MAVNSSDRNAQAGNGMQGTSYIYNQGASPNTRTAVSQKIRILAPAYGENTALHQMGVVSQFAPTMSRTVDNVRGVGYGDKIAELVPSVTEPTTGNLERALLYLCNLWQGTGYAAGVDGPVRSLAHHKWPFDLEQQIVFSTLADMDIGAEATGGTSGTSGQFDGGVKRISYPKVTQDPKSQPGDGARGHTAIITIYEACWFTSWNVTFAKDSGVIMESGDVIVSDVHDFASVYGEFLATGNDPSIGQLGSIRFQGLGGPFTQAGEGITGGAAINTRVTA